MSQQNASPVLAFTLAGTGLAAFVGLIAADRLLGFHLGFPGVFLWLLVALLPAAGIALLFHGAAIERAEPPSAHPRDREFRP